MEGGHLAQALEVGRFTRQDVVAGDRLERFSREAEVHGVARFVREIDGEPAENRVHSGNFSEAPASMHAIAAGGELNERLQLLAADFSSAQQFFKLFSHIVSRA